MRYAVLSDIHGNLEALMAVVSSIKNECVEQILCAGDIVGYGANPQECIDYIRQNKIPCVAGNHDWAVASKITMERFNPYAKEAVYWTQKILSLEDQFFLEKLPLKFENQNFVMIHGSLNAPEQFQYIFETADAYLSFESLTKSLCFVGHTHVPKIFVQKGSNTKEEFRRTISLQSGLRYLVNVGGLGQPRDGNPQASYCFCDTEKHELLIRRVPYNIKEAQKKIIKAGLPSILATRLAFGS